MSRKELAIAFLQRAGTGDVRAAYEDCIAPDFIHHNQYFKGDRESLLLAMEQAHAASPNRAVEVQHVYEDGDTVITHSRVVRQDPELPSIAVVHIFRFAGERVVELWDVGQVIVADSPNAHGVF